MKSNQAPPSMTSGQPKKAVPPHCATCGASHPMAVLRQGAEPDALGGLTSHEWLCGECLYLRDNPNAARVPAPQRRARVPQKETLLDVLGSPNK